MTKERIAFVDYIRVIACLLVMVVHASEQFYNMGPVSQVATEDNRLWVSIYDGFFGRISVPLFMIVSAFLLVPMREGMTMSQFYRRRFLRILPPFVCFLVLYAVLPATWGGLTWEEAVEQLKMVPFNFPQWGGHLWFMYPLISLYLIIPVVSPWLERSSAEDERIFLGIFAFSTLTREFCTPNVLLATFGAFLLFTCIEKAPRWINSLAKQTFGMYLMHIFFLVFIAEWIIGGNVARPLLPVWLAIPVIGLLTFLCCAVTTKLLSLIPGSKYVIG